MAVNGIDDLLLFGFVNTDAFKSLPRSAVRADEGFIVLAGERRRCGIGVTAPRQIFMLRILVSLLS